MSSPPPEAGQGQRATGGPWPVALAGLVALAVAMGIGRFAFTPLLPMMLNDGVVDLPGASWLASANYLGYLLGALLCMLQPWIWSRWRARGLPLLRFSALVRAGLLATGGLTLAMAWPAPAVWPLLRFVSGMVSAVVFVYTSGWCLSQLSRRGVPGMGGIIYAGPGAGIAVSGLLASAMVAWQWSAATGWLIFGALALVLSATVWRILKGGEERLQVLSAPVPPAASLDTHPGAAPVANHGAGEMALFALAYGLAGFGYIITATFLPVIARTALPGSAWLDLFWPIFGGGVMVGALLAASLPQGQDFRARLGVCYVLQAAGIATSVVSPSLAGFAVGSLLVGLPFTVISFFAMQEARRLRPLAAASAIGLVTATYGVGQILGPPLVAVLLKRSSSAAAGFTLSLEMAAGALLLGAALYAWLIKAYPLAAR